MSKQGRHFRRHDREPGLERLAQRVEQQMFRFSRAAIKPLAASHQHSVVGLDCNPADTQPFRNNPGSVSWHHHGQRIFKSGHVPG